MPDEPPTNQANAGAFRAQLTKEYERLFREDASYARVRADMTPESLAQKMTIALVTNTGNKDGLGIKRTCKALGIPYTYTGLKTFFTAK